MRGPGDSVTKRLVHRRVQNEAGAHYPKRSRMRARCEYAPYRATLIEKDEAVMPARKNRTAGHSQCGPVRAHGKISANHPYCDSVTEV